MGYLKFLFIRFAFCTIFAIASCIIASAQNPSATPPPDQRGLGLDTSNTATKSQTDQKAREAKPELVLQTGYSNFFGATRIVFSPDGRLLATATFRSSTIKLWETATGRELRNLSGGPQSGMTLAPFVAFSRDNRFVAGASGDNSLKIWDVTSGREVQTLAGPQGSITSALGGVNFIAFTPDGRLVTISDAIRVWDTNAGRELLTIPMDPASGIAFIGGAAGAVLSPDGRQLGLLTTDGATSVAKFVELATGRESRSIKLSGQDFDSADLAFTPNGRLRICGIVEKRVRLLEMSVNDGAKPASSELGLAATMFAQVSFSHDGRFLALADGYTVQLWDAATGNKLPDLKLPNSGVFASQARAFASFSDDGKRIATGGFDTPTILWETETGKQLLAMNGRTNMAYEVAFSADGNSLSSGGRTRWDLRTGRGLRVAAAPSATVFGVPSPDGKLLASFRPTNNVLTILETPSGKQLRTLTPASGGGVVEHARFSANGALLVVSYGASQEQMNRPMSGAQSATNESVVKIWDVASGRELHTLTLGIAGALEAGFSADGRVLATLSSMGQVSLWDTASGSRLRDLTTSPLDSITKMGGAPNMPNMPNMGSRGNIADLAKMGAMKPGAMPNMADLTSMITNMMGAASAGTLGRTVTSIAFSPDGRTLAIGGVESKSNFDVATLVSGGAANRSKKKKDAVPDPQDFMKDMKVEAIGQVVLWDVASGREFGALKGHGKGVTKVAFSHDGRLLASGSSDNTIRIWDVATQRELRTMAGQSANIESLDFSPDGKLLASAGDDGSTFLWDTTSGEHLLTLISLDDGGEWMVVTPQGLFDGTPVSWNQILWRYNQDTFNVAPIEWFFNEFYYPGLLADVIAGKRPRVAQDVSRKDRRQPIVKLSVAGEPSPNAVTARTVKVRIDVADVPADKENPQGTGARDLRLFRNGSLVKVWHGDVLKGAPAVTLEEEITITAGPNRLTAYAFNRDNVKSKDAPLLLNGADTLKRGGTAYIIAVGINEYSNPQYNLKYAVADATSFGEEVSGRQAQLGRFEHIEVVPLLNENATKANVLAALKRLAGASEAPSLKASPMDRLKRAEPEDTVIIYFAGHGTAQAQRFYLIPHDLGYAGDRTKLTAHGLQTILASSISDLELEAAVEGLDAGHLLLIIDACNSGQALEAEEKRRGPMNSKGLAQLAYEKGMYILTAAQGYQAALEVSQLGHGLLTYALVEEGLKTSIADSGPADGVVSVREWLDFATERVPQMQEEKLKATRGVGLTFTEGESTIADPQKRSLQRPRAFYRRELEANPLVIAKP
ncbi:MAG: hypothetical protein QOE77_1554 [Blastocatellia bacterium]|jgi:WD40 repeat protein/uncharacterized caspase-like protein|nr:hypothetical protein [Blastocatellia bacterium]